jgi:hypothetical protein
VRCGESSNGGSRNREEVSTGEVARIIFHRSKTG